MFDSCLFGDYGYENQLYWATTPRAGKAHECCECLGEIKKGERHELVKGKTDDAWWSSRTCLICVRVRVSVCRGEWLFGDLWDRIVGAYCVTGEDETAMVPDTWLARRRHFKNPLQRSQ